MTDSDDLADRIAALRADNARLRRLLDETGMHDGMRHAFRDTVAILRAILRRTAETSEKVESYAAHLDARLDSIVRVRNRLDEFGEVDLHSLVSDELMVHGANEGERALLDGPRVRLRPRAAQVLAVAVHELASNAVEHGALGGPQGRVDVAWRVEPGEVVPVLSLVWKETGATGIVLPARRGFGTTVLEEMLGYDLRAQTSLAYEADGVRCSLAIPLTDRVGHLAD